MRWRRSVLILPRVAGSQQEGFVVETPWRMLAEQLVFARPETDDDARGVLEWVARRDGKSLGQLVDELWRPGGVPEPT